MSYEEVCDLGRGGFAKVIKVKKEDIEYAKKIFSPNEQILQNVEEEELKKRFVREVKYQKSLDHRNILKIHEEFLAEQPPYFIMPLAEGTLSEELKNGVELNKEDISKILFDILAGLEALHLNGFNHRDLKPANVLKFLEDGEVIYKISDFGLISSNESDSTTLTASGQGAGTQNYSAPELINGGFKKATFRADIYSFGAILHDIFAKGVARIPYAKIEFTGKIGEIMSKCTEPNPLRRYRSVIQLREDLYDCLDTSEITYESAMEKSLIKLLQEKEEKLLDDEWDKIFAYLDDDNNSNYNIYKVLKAEHITELNAIPELFNAMGEYYSEYIQKNHHDFDYCDVLASKAQIFYDEGELGLKAKVVVALLILGTSHNRWYVERKLMRMIDKEITEALAKRIRTELDVQEINFLSKMNHLFGSIGTTEENIHPILKDFLEELRNAWYFILFFTR